MLEVLLSITLSFCITLFTIPIIIVIAQSKNLYDTPNERKIHTSKIASLGGFAIFTGFILATLLSILYSNAPEFQYYIAAAFLIFFLGLKDDIVPLSPFKKFLGQLLAGSLIIFKGGIVITSMHGFLNMYELPHMVKLMLTFLTVILIINAFNLIDGIDGLASSLAIMITVILGTYFLKIELIPYAVLSFSLAGSLTAFLIFNFHPAKIFMGDSGSLLIGLVISILAIKFINVAPDNPILLISSSPAIAFSLLLIPLLDTLRLFSLRIFSRRSPFMPDKNHIHHILLEKGFSHKKITLSLLALNLVFISATVMYNNIGSTWLILGQSGLFFAAIGILCAKREKPGVYTVPKREPSIKSITLPNTISLSRDNISIREN